MMMTVQMKYDDDDDNKLIMIPTSADVVPLSNLPFSLAPSMLNSIRGEGLTITIIITIYSKITIISVIKTLVVVI